MAVWPSSLYWLRGPNIIIWSHVLCQVHHPFKAQFSLAFYSSLPYPLLDWIIPLALHVSDPFIYLMFRDLSELFLLTVLLIPSPRLAAAEYAKILAQRQKEAKEAKELKRKRWAER